MLPDSSPGIIRQFGRLSVALTLLARITSSTTHSSTRTGRPREVAQGEKKIAQLLSSEVILERALQHLSWLDSHPYEVPGAVMLSGIKFPLSWLLSQYIPSF